MEFLRSLRHLWRHRLLRRLLAVRVATQSADGVLQVALASFVLFSPQQQPDAASVATVLAITLLPFSVLGPFVGIVLDRWSRRQVLVVLDLSRAVVALALGAAVATGLRTGPIEIAFYAGVLILMSLNRFLLAALSAGLPHTVEPGEYMVANSVMPTIGPAGAVIGVGLGTTLRLAIGSVAPDYWANAALLAVSAVGFVISASIASRIPRDALGPDLVPDAGGDAGPDQGPPHGRPARAGDVIAGLAEALRHLRARPEAGLGLLAIFAHRVVYGVVTVAMILLFRNYLHPITAVGPALADLGLLAVCTAAGFVTAAAVTPPGSARFGVRRWMVVVLVVSAVFQLVPGAVFARVPLLAAGFLLGVTAQSIKLCVDTLVQAHVDDELKGRVFVLYDMIFNVALVLAAVLSTFILPADGRSLTVMVVLAAAYLALGIVFGVVSRGLSLDAGTESLRATGSPERA